MAKATCVALFVLVLGAWALHAEAWAGRPWMSAAPPASVSTAAAAVFPSKRIKLNGVVSAFLCQHIYLSIDLNSLFLSLSLSLSFSLFLSLSLSLALRPPLTGALCARHGGPGIAVVAYCNSLARLCGKHRLLVMHPTCLLVIYIEDAPFSSSLS